MAESDTILQLGIEAAREGNREEARNLFGLLTRQEPNNAQAWLWLAGVAEGPEQRRAALERVVELDPTNDMAIKGLQAMGVRPTSRLDDDAAPAAETPPPAASVPAREMTDEERYALELDSAFDDYDALPRAEVPPRAEPSDAEAPGDTLAAERSTGRATPRGTARERSAARRGTTPIHSGDDDDDDYLRAAAPRRGLSPLLLGLIGLIVAVLLCVVAYPFIQRLFSRSGGATASATATAQAIAGAPTPGPTEALPGTGVTSTGGLTPTSELSGTGSPTDTTSITPTAPVTGTAATAQPAPAPSADLSAANPQIVPPDNPLSVNGWTYNYPNSLCPVSCAAIIGGPIGGSSAKGKYLTVLVSAANNTGTAQPIPANFFVLKDGQGRVYDPLPQLSSAYLQRGSNGDISQEEPIPANNTLTSMPLIFDVQPDATNFVLFARDKTDQGWQLNVAQ